MKLDELCHNKNAYVATNHSGNNIVRQEKICATMTQEEYKAEMLRQTHNKDEDLRNCTYVVTFINFVTTNLTKDRH